MFATLRSRLWSSYLFLILVVLGVLSVSLVFYLARHPIAQRESLLRLNITAESIARLGDFNLSGLPVSRLEEIVGRLAERTGQRILVLNADGAPVADSAPPDISTLPFSPAILTTDRGLIRDQAGQMWYFGARPIQNGFLIVAVPRPRVIATVLNVLTNTLADELLLPFLQSGLIALFLSLLLGYFISRSISNPLQKMAAAAQAITAGEYPQIPVHGPREVQDLARMFNEMTTQVRASQQSQRNFVANVSHELKTPLTSIQGFSQAILDGTAATGEEQKQAAEVIFSEAGRLNRMVNDLLDLARLEGGTMTLERAPVDLNALLELVLDKFTPQAALAQVTLHPKITQLPLVIGDSDRLAQVFTNLMDNAIKFTPAGGAVTLQADPIGDQVRIAVKDTGPGIPENKLSRIFERFYQLDQSRRGGQGRGVGLGLPIALEIVQAHSGKIYAHSGDGEGCVFIVDLPVARPDDSTLISRQLSGR